MASFVLQSHSHIVPFKIATDTGMARGGGGARGLQLPPPPPPRAFLEIIKCY